MGKEEKYYFIVSSNDWDKSNAESVKSSLEELKKSILQKAFAGELVR